MKKIVSFVICAFFILVSLSFAEEEARLLRFPAVYENQVVFTYAGDLYTVGSEGGVARKLTGHDGFETFPRFSPDGKYIAFTAQYDGNTEVYLMDAGGGIPKRLTYTASLPRDDVSDRMGPNNIVMTWKHDNKHIVFRSRMIESDDMKGQLFYTTIEGDLHEPLPLPRGGFCSFSPDDTKLAYNRIFREFRTWKRYRGGMADDIWIYDFNSKETKNITNNPTLDIIPMWKDDNIYFLSDRGPEERLNLYVYNTKTEETRRLTDFKEFDIKFPSLGKAVIAFENGGYIYLFDTGTEQLKKLSVFIKDDRLHARGGITKVNKNITNYEIAPDGKRALFGARGEIFTVPVKYGNTRNLTNSPGVHERDSQWSPDGKWIAYISDASGENEIYIIPQDGSSKPIPITNGADTYMYNIKWSPDSLKLLWADRKLRLRFADIEKKVITEVDKGEYGEIRDYNWSPDSKWITYDKTGKNQLDKIYLYSLENKKGYEATDEWYDCDEPVFSSCGKYLFFISSRDYNPNLGENEFNFIYQDMSRLYLVTLAKDIPSPFTPKSDETEVSKTSAAAGEKTKKEEKKTTTAAVPAVKVDIDGIKDRIIALAVSPSRYGGLASVGNALYYLRKGSKDEKTLLMVFDLEKQEETQVGEFDGYKVSADSKKMLVAKGGTYAIIDLPTAKTDIKDKLDLDNMEMRLCLQCEWKNIFNECWRQMRDFFYVVNMHGLDWEKTRKQYEPLVAHVNHRNDLTYIIGEMIGELNIGHAYVGGGERPEVKKIPTGLLGAVLEKDPKTGYYKIAKILKGQNWDKKVISPLTEVGVKANPGDYIIAVNGESTADMKNIYKALVNTVGKQVRLTLNSIPGATGTWDAVVVPIENEVSLYYYNWVQENIEKVDKATGGKVGYLHIPDMGLDGLNEFIKHYYPQLSKKALIVDARFNGGGFVSELIIERLRREIAFINVSRYVSPTPNPDGMMYGPMVCLTDEFAGSDGDIFPYRFKKYGMGKVIGKRTWGGAVGIRDTLPLLDGGNLYKPEFAFYDPEGKGYCIEGYGVDPDIYVDNDPAKQFAGIDEQLNKAIEVIREELKTKEKTIPPLPPDPVKVPKKQG